MRSVVVDTGPLVAVLNRDDDHHEWAAEHFARLSPPLQTCEAVLSEASFLLGHGTAGCRALLALVERGIVQATFRFHDDASRVASLVARYESVPMAFADACLVRMTERVDDVIVWTVDRDFLVYRRNGRQKIPTLLPPR